MMNILCATLFIDEIFLDEKDVVALAKDGIEAEEAESFFFFF